MLATSLLTIGLMLDAVELVQGLLTLLDLLRKSLVIKISLIKFLEIQDPHPMKLIEIAVPDNY